MTDDENNLVKIFDNENEAEKFAGSKAFAGYGESYRLTKKQVEELMAGKYIAFTGMEYGLILSLEDEAINDIN